MYYNIVMENGVKESEEKINKNDIYKDNKEENEEEEEEKEE